MKNIIRTLWFIVFVLCVTELSMPVMYGAPASTSKRKVTSKKRGKKRARVKKKKKRAVKKKKVIKKRKVASPSKPTSKVAHAPQRLEKAAAKPKHAVAKRKEPIKPASLKTVIAQDIEEMFTQTYPHMLRFGVFMKLKEQQESWKGAFKLWFSGNTENLNRIIDFMEKNFVIADITAIKQSTARLLVVIHDNRGYRSFIDTYLKHPGFFLKAEGELKALSQVLSGPVSYQHIAVHFDRIEQLLRTLPDIALRFSRQQIVDEGVKVLRTLAEDKRLDEQSRLFVQNKLIPQVLTSA